MVNASALMSQREGFTFNKTESIKMRKVEEDYMIVKAIQVRKKEETMPMSGRRRKMAEVTMVFDDILIDDREIRSKDNETEPIEKEQYILTTVRQPRGAFCSSFLSCIGCFPRQYGGELNCDRALIFYLQWTFNASFFTLFVSFCFFFMLFVILFAAFIELGAKLKTDCINPNAANLQFSDFFALSWTTFSTVGYGHIYPALSVEEEETGHCAFITFLTSLESFIGVLYAGFCGAIIFGKVMRIQSRAQVLFTDSLLIQYNVSNENGSKESRSTFPVLEFRIYNRDYHKVGSEIINASLSCLVINSKLIENSNSRNSLNFEENEFKNIDYSYSKLEFDVQEHPYFKTRWIARHTIDEKSPILRGWVKKRIESNGGTWPADLNNYEDIRRCLKFGQIIVNLSGTSNISASSVYAHKIYDNFDMCIGYEFVNIVYKDRTTKLDLNLINDIVEQDGGGGEPLIVKDQE